MRRYFARCRALWQLRVAMTGCVGNNYVRPGNANRPHQAAQSAIMTPDSHGLFERLREPEFGHVQEHQLRAGNLRRAHHLVRTDDPQRVIQFRPDFVLATLTTGRYDRKRFVPVFFPVLGQCRAILIVGMGRDAHEAQVRAQITK